MKKEKDIARRWFYWLIIFGLIAFFSCSPVRKADNRFVYMRIMEVEKKDSGYWVYFRDRSNIYKSFQYEKPDTVQPGKIVKMSRVFKLSGSLH